MKQIKHIFFDLDHTLWDFEANSAKTFEKILKDNAIDVDVALFLNEYIPINLQYWKLFRENKVDKKELKYGRLKDSFNALNYSISDEMIHKLATHYLEVLPTFNEVFENTFKILDYLKQKYTLHIITNGFSEIQHVKLKKSNLHTYFDKIITSESVGVKKPNPTIFEYALNLANAKKEESIMIGDSWEADIMGAINFGIQAIYCNFDNKPFDASIPSFTNLIDLKIYL